jgi:TusA-related sulfurtransferase
MMHELVFDLRGRICPSTLLVAMKEMNDHRQQILQGSLRLRLLVENRDATVTIPEMARNMGYQVQVSKEGRHYELLISASA